MPLNIPQPWDGETFGRLKVRGPAISKAYFKGDGGEILDGNGFFDTGDVAHIDEHGYMQITDRAKDLIKSGGEWISSVDLENAAMEHGEVALAAVIGISHPKWEERPLLVVVRSDGSGLTSKELEVLEYSALLHDIGKIAIQKEVLHKVGRLTDEERRSLTSHPSIGADIVENLKFLKEAAEIVRYHHEQPDGRGYPAGLKGDEIPIGSRILLCADAFDAMTSDRPYRKGLPLEMVLEQFEKFKGTQFDTNAVDLLVGMVKTGEFQLIVETDPTTAIYESLKQRL